VETEFKVAAGSRIKWLKSKCLFSDGLSFHKKYSTKFSRVYFNPGFRPGDRDQQVLISIDG
jgi:hypothetical protein